MLVSWIYYDRQAIVGASGSRASAAFRSFSENSGPPLTRPGVDGRSEPAAVGLDCRAGVEAHTGKRKALLVGEALHRHLAPQPATVKAFDVREELVDHGIAGLESLHLELARARRAVVLADLLELWIRPGHLRVYLE